MFHRIIAVFNRSAMVPGTFATELDISSHGSIYKQSIVTYLSYWLNKNRTLDIDGVCDLIVKHPKVLSKAQSHIKSPSKK